MRNLYRFLFLLLMFNTSSLFSDDVEEIVVTGLKRTSSVEDASASITVLSGSEIDDRGIIDLKDIKFAAPSLNYTEVFYSSNISIRGVGALVGGSGQPGVSVVTDGVYQLVDTTSQLASLDLSRIEILRGPQGTLHGRNSVGGTVNYYTTEPSQESDGYLKIGFAEYSQQKLEGAYGQGISDNTSFRFSFNTTKKDEGFTKNLSEGAYEIGTQDTETFRLKIKSDLSDNITARMTFASTSVEGTPAPYVWLQDLRYKVGVIQNKNDQLTLNPHEVYVTPEGPLGKDFLEQEYDFASLVLDINTEFGTIKSITSKQDYSFLGAQDRDALEFPYTSNRGLHESEALTQEINWNIVNDNIDLIVGVYYLKDDSFRDEIFQFAPVVFNGLKFVFDQPEYDTTSKSIFLDATFDITDKTNASVGIRKTEDEIINTQNNSNVIAAFGLTIPTCDRTIKIEDSNTMSRLALNHELDNGNNIYASLSEGYKVGGVNYLVCDDPYSSEELESFEIGYKGDLNDKTTIQIAVFDYDYSNFQTFQVVETTAFIKNAGDASLTGLEIETFTDINGQLSMTTGITYLNSEYGDFINSSSVAPELGFQNVKGNSLNYIPDLSVNWGFISSKFDSKGNSWTNRLDIAYRGNTSFSEFSPDKGGFEQSAYTVVNLNMIWESADEELSVRAYAKNASNSEYVAGFNAGGFNGGTFGTWGAPRVLGIEVKRNF